MGQGEGTHMFLFKCMHLFVQIMRRVIRQRLEKTFGNLWWEEGVLAVLPEARRESLRRNLQDCLVHEHEDLREPRDFPDITKGHADGAFRGVFLNHGDAYWSLRYIAGVRPHLAHFRDVPADVAQRSAGHMMHILYSLGCKEALEIKDALKRFAVIADIEAMEGALVDQQVPIGFGALGLRGLREGDGVMTILRNRLRKSLAGPISCVWRTLTSPAARSRAS